MRKDNILIFWCFPSWQPQVSSLDCLCCMGAGNVSDMCHPIQGFHGLTGYKEYSDLFPSVLLSPIGSSLEGILSADRDLCTMEFMRAWQTSL